MNEENCMEFIKEQFKGVQFDILWNRAMFQIKAGI